MLPRHTSYIGIRAVAFLALASLLGACGGAPGSGGASGSAPAESAGTTSSAFVSLTPEPTASASPSPTPTPSPSPTPDQASVPLFAAGTEVATTTIVRVRDLPGTNWGVTTTLPAGAKLTVVLGPIRTAGFGWYLVSDADPAAPTFKEGWVAAGYQPNAFLEPLNEEPAFNPYVASFANTSPGDFGPVSLDGPGYGLRWAAAVPVDAAAGATCTFTASLVPAGGAAVDFANTEVATAPAPGTVLPQFLTDHPTLTGQLTLRIAGDCSWAVTVAALSGAPSPTPGTSPTP
jgi:hypothetical protein